MKSLYELGCRIYQTVFKLAIPILPYRRPERLKDYAEVVKVLKGHEVDSVIIVTDAGLRKTGIIDDFMKGFDQSDIKIVVYDKTVANPTIENIMEAKRLYEEGSCKAIIAIGGGSSMDCAKGLGAKIARPNKDIRKMKGVLKVLKKIPLLIAVPTTAGTGSETTLAAVITDEKTHFKYQRLCLDPRICASRAEAYIITSEVFDFNDWHGCTDARC